ncbi:MAG: hypothetical protein ABFR33_06430 [Verrucomicrobiota bacterium]
MKRHQYGKTGLIACVVALFATMQVLAVDLAAASGFLADIAVAATQANAALAAAANSGDTDAIAAAQADVDAVKSSMEEGLAAHAEISAGNNAAMKDLVAARNAALGVTGGTASDSAPPGKKGHTIPNIEEVPWQSPELKALYQEMSEIIQNEGGHGYPERDVTTT